MAETSNAFEGLSQLPDTDLGEALNENKSNKRKEWPSASSDDSSPLHKKQLDDSVFENLEQSKDMADMSWKDAFESLQKTLLTLASKSDFELLRGEIEKIRNEIGQFSTAVHERIDKVEERCTCSFMVLVSMPTSCSGLV